MHQQTARKTGHVDYPDKSADLQRGGRTSGSISLQAPHVSGCRKQVTDLKSAAFAPLRDGMQGAKAEPSVLARRST